MSLRNARRVRLALCILQHGRGTWMGLAKASIPSFVVRCWPKLPVLPIAGKAVAGSLECPA